MFLLLATFNTSFSISPGLSDTCTYVANRLLVDQRAGLITHSQASVAFEQCQIRFPWGSPDQPSGSS